MGDDNTRKSKAKKPAPTSESVMQVPAHPQVSDLIGRRLRSYYDEIAKQPVPDRFLDLLQQLESTEASKRKAGRNGNSN